MSQFLDKFRAAGGDVEGVMERFMSDEELLQDCLKQFVAEEGFSKLAVAIEHKDYNEAFEQAHALKGITGNLGLSPLYDALCQLVEALRGNKYDRLPPLQETVMKAKEDFWEHYKEMQ